MQPSCPVPDPGEVARTGDSAYDQLGMTEASIIVPLLCQRDEWLAHCVRSALDQTVACEVIVVTSPQTPRPNRRVLEDLQAMHGNLVVVEQPPGTGYARAFNVGIRHAAAGRVGFLLSDDWLSPDALSATLALTADIVSTGLTIFDSSGRRVVGERRLNAACFSSLPTLELKANYLKHFLLFSKDKLQQAGGVDEHVGLTGPDDYDLVWTMLENGASVSMTGRPCYNYRDHFGQRLSLRSREDQVRDLRRILAKHGVRGLERDAVIARRSRWYGLPVRMNRKPAPGTAG